MNGLKYTVTESRTVWGSLLITMVWAVASRYGVDIPSEIPLTAIGAIGVKEAAGKLRAE